MNSLYGGNLILERKKVLWWVGEMKRQLLKTFSYVCYGQLLFGVKLGQLLLVQKEVKITSGLIPKAPPPPPFCTMQIIQKMYFPIDCPLQDVFSNLDNGISLLPSLDQRSLLLLIFKFNPHIVDRISVWRRKSTSCSLHGWSIMSAQAARPPCQDGDQTLC